MLTYPFQNLFILRIISVRSGKYQLILYPEQEKKDIMQFLPLNF